jgi:pSer/pThr/pTyr-binding forkhead associated (FHA) protein
MKSANPSSTLIDFLGRFRAALVILSGEARGMEYGLDQPRTALGRGPGVDLALDDVALRCQHALVEFNGSGFELRDFGSDARGVELKNGDCFRLGTHEFAFVLEQRL